MVCCGFALLDLGLFFGYHDDRLGIGAFLAAVFGLSVAAARVATRRGRTRLAVAMVVYPVLAVALFTVLLLPMLFPMLETAPLLALGIAFTYLRGRTLVILGILSGLTSIGVAWMGMTLVAPPLNPPWAALLSNILGGPIATMLILLLITQHTHRIQEHVSAVEAQNIALEQARATLARHHAEIQRLNAELEQKVQQRTAELEVMNRELEAFSWSVSHDLRAPLRRIQGFSEALQEDYSHALDPQARDYLARIHSSVQRMTKLIEDLLQLSRIQRMELRRARISLSELAAAVADELIRSAPERSIRLQITPDLWVVADPSLLRIALENLLSNAWKYTARTPNAQIEVGREGEAWFIRDNGAGFDMAHRDRLFTPFQRLHSNADFPGTGIGLAIVQRIIHRHGGTIWATGAPNAGATFSFTLPE